MYSKRNILTIALLLSLTLIGACGSGSSSEAGEDGDGGGGSTGTASTDIPADADAFFLPKSDISGQSLPAGGSTITWDDGVIYLIRYIPSATEYVSMDTAMYESFGCASSGYPVTVSGDILYRIRLCPDYDDGSALFDVKSIDPNSGSTTELCTNAYQNSASGHAAIVGSAIFYRNTSDDLVKQPLPCTSETTLLDSTDDDNSGTLFGVGANLISVKDDTAVNSEYDIRSHSTTTGMVAQDLISVDDTDVYDGSSFYAGDDAMFWFFYDDATLAFQVYRYALTGTPELIMNTTLPYELQSGAGSVIIDSSNGKVLIAYQVITARDGSGYTTSTDAYFFVYDVDAGTTTEIDSDEFFFSQKMQYMYNG